MKITTANDVMDIVAEKVITDGEFESNDEAIVHINGSGSTTLMEMFILYNRLDSILKERGIIPYKPLIGNMITTQEMAGFSLTLCKTDDEIKRFWSAPADTPYFKVSGND